MTAIFAPVDFFFNQVTLLLFSNDSLKILIFYCYFLLPSLVWRPFALSLKHVPWDRLCTQEINEHGVKTIHRVLGGNRASLFSLLFFRIFFFCFICLQSNDKFPSTLLEKIFPWYLFKIIIKPFIIIFIIWNVMKFIPLQSAMIIMR